MATGPQLKAGAPIPVGRVLLRMAEQSRQLITRRAFPTNGRAGRSVTGRNFRRLTPRYAKWKASKGRPPVPDQRFTSGTANALGVLSRSETRVVLGFRTRRKVAEGLQKRNNFFGVSRAEEKAVVDIARQAGAQYAASVRVDRRTVVIDFG